jgi:predicted Zn-dependent protease
VTPEMFGTYQYGSDLLNVTFDPTQADEFASYAFDDDGVAATRVPLIERGVLLRPLGGVISQARAGLPGVANGRATSWNRPPIDRMANINVEPGDQPLEALIGGVERGVFMTSNCSWSIDDSRNKFQFGCELGRLIVDGELGPIVRNPNYRGVSASFWRSLSAVGDRSTAGIMGSPFCGKGEPNQIIRVGHASPTCVFSNVEIFGGDA